MPFRAKYAGVGTAIGIGAGISIHVVYTLLGIGALMHTAPWLMRIAKMVGGLYLLYLGYVFIRKARDYTTPIALETDGVNGKRNFQQSFLLGIYDQCHQP